jgi:hypothetical protein
MPISSRTTLVSLTTGYNANSPYIESFWVFESPNGFPATDSSVVAPNGFAAGYRCWPREGFAAGSARDAVEVKIAKEALIAAKRRDFATI